jgi:hypothetical protein
MRPFFMGLQPGFLNKAAGWGSWFPTLAKNAKDGARRLLWLEKEKL